MNENSNIATNGKTQNSRLKLAAIAQELIECLDEDGARPGLIKTPQRFAAAMLELTAGYAMNLETLINGAIYTAPPTKGLVVVSGIHFHSLCEHHLLPFQGIVNVAYLPGEHIIGLSKIPRIVKMYARRLQLQERLTHQIAQALSATLKPQGVGVSIKARHSCLEMRGARAGGSEMITTAYLGKLQECPSMRDEFLNLIPK